MFNLVEETLELLHSIVIVFDETTATQHWHHPQAVSGCGEEPIAHHPQAVDQTAKRCLSPWGS